MRPLTRFLFITTALVLLLLLLGHQFSNWSKQEKQQRLHKNQRTKDFNQTHNAEATHQLEKSWLNSLVEKFLGQPQEDGIFSPVEQGYMNYRLSRPMRFESDEQEKSSWKVAENEWISILPNVTISDTYKTLMGGESAYERKELVAELRNRLRCNSNKYDQLIEQGISKNALSRPVITSNGRFDNPFPTWNHASITGIIQFMLEPSEANVPNNRDELEKALPLLKPNFEATKQADTEYRVTWIGHSTLIIQVDGFNIMTDPIFSDRASFSRYFGPKRIRDPACDIKSLPRIDIVLISHNHYDHLDADSVKQLNDRFGSNCRWIVPLGLGEFLRSMYVQNYVELDWWQKDCFSVLPNTGASIKSENDLKVELSPILKTRKMISDTEINPSDNKNITDRGSDQLKTDLSELDVYLTPSQHWSRRWIADTNKSLWGSFTIVSKSGATFFFAGDSGYCSAFKEIGKIFGPFAGAAIPIGAYKPRWFLKAQHVDPDEAVQVHKDLRSKKSIAIHHSTFILSNEDYREPARLLREIMQEHRANGSFTNEPFVALKHGESAEFCGAC